MNKYKCEKCENAVEIEQTEGIVYCEKCGAEINIGEQNRKTEGHAEFIKGVGYSKKGEWNSAILAYTEALKLDSEIYLAYLYRFLAKHETDRTNYAIRSLIMNLEALDDEDYILFKQMAPEDEVAQFLKYEEIREKEQESEKQKEREETLIDNGREALKKEDWTQAGECFDKVFDSSPNNPDAMLGKYMAEYHCKDKQELMLRAIEISRDDIRTWTKITAYLPIAEERQWRKTRREYIGTKPMKEFEKEGEDSAGQENSDKDVFASSDEESETADETGNPETIKDMLESLINDEAEFKTVIEEAFWGAAADEEPNGAATSDEPEDEAINGITSLIPVVRKTVSSSKEIAAFRVYLILKDGYIALENGRFDAAKECFELVISQKDEADHSDVGSAQIGLLLTEYKLPSMETLKNKFIECTDENGDFYKKIKYYFTEKYPEREFTFKKWERARKRKMKS